MENQNQEILTLSAYDNFLYALKSKESKRQYPNRLDLFLTFIGLQGTIKEKCGNLAKINDVKLLESHIIRFVNFQKERIENKEIGISLVYGEYLTYNDSNYYK
jgi:hypothetical protein